MSTEFVKRESAYERGSRHHKQRDIKLGWKLHQISGLAVYNHKEYDDMLVVNDDTGESLYRIDTQFTEATMSAEEEYEITLTVVADQALFYFFSISECVKWIRSNAPSKAKGDENE